MLSETWRLRQALERSKTKLSRKHKRIRPPGRTSPCVRVCLGSHGGVDSVQDISDDEWPTWTVMEGNQNSFPVVRVQQPLYHLPPNHEAWAKLGYAANGKRRRPPAGRVRVETIESVLRDGEAQPLSTRGRTLWTRLRNKAGELLQYGERDQRIKPVASVAQRFMEAAGSPETFLKRVADEAVARLRQGRLQAIDLAEQLVVGRGPPGADGKLPPMTVQLAFDTAETAERPPSLYSPAVRDCMIEVLPHDPPQGGGSPRTAQREDPVVDALTGEPAEVERKTFPKVDLPVWSTRKRTRIGRKPFPLASMFSEAPCNARYGMSDAGVFPVGKARAIRLKEALERITADDRREKTWQHVASGRFDVQAGRKIEKPDLLIAYVEEQPMLDAKTAGYFGQGPGVTQAKFEVDAAAVCAALRGIAGEPNSKLNLFLIREVSKGQAQVVLAESPTVTDVLNAASRWQQAVQNTPAVTLHLQPGKSFGKQDTAEVRDARPLAPYPDQVVGLLSYQWVRDGSSSRKGEGDKPQRPNQAIVGPGLADVLALMLRAEGKWEPAAMRMLDLLIGRVGPLLTGLFAAKHAYGPRNEQGKHEPAYPRQSRETALRAVAVFGILLDALSSRKEDYMKDAPYQVGQVLSLADTLHKDYCVVVRKGDLPNSLVGTSLMRRALDSPAGALADLSERMMEYLRWAKVAQVPADWKPDDQRRIAVNEARKKLRQYQPLAEALGACDLPKECDDIMKAQLLLGFLANPPEE